MALRLTAVVLLLALFTACATPRVVRLDTGQGAPLEYRPPTSHESVVVDEDDFEEAPSRFLRRRRPLSPRCCSSTWEWRASWSWWRPAGS